MTALLLTLLLGAEPADRPVVIVVVGAAGAAEYAGPFGQWADQWREAAEKGAATFHQLGSDESDETNDRQRLETLLGEQSKQSAEPLWLVLLGHGTFDGRQARFNLRGADLSATTLGEWLEPFARPLAVVNCASSSAPFINRLSAPNRVLLTATKSGYELNYARFGQHLAAAIADPAADLDKDEQTSLLEAFLLASRRVEEFYEQEARLATETALLDDNGDGLGTSADWFRGTRSVRKAKEGLSADGVRAHQFHLLRSPREQSLPGEVRRRRDELLAAIAVARESKAQAANEDQHYAALEPLLIELARLYESADESSP